MLNVAFGISFNQSICFVEYIRANSSNQKYRFEFSDREIRFHPFLIDKVKKSKKKKEEIYSCLIGEDLFTYFDVKEQVFKFNEKILSSSEEDLSTYQYNIDPDEYIRKFEEDNKKLEENSKIVKLVHKIPKEDKPNFVSKLSSSYSEFIDYFLEYFKDKHASHGKSLFIYASNKSLLTLVEKKIEYFNFFNKTSSFKDALGMIKYFLNQEQIDFIDKRNPSNFTALKKVAEMYDEFVKSNPKAAGNVLVAPIFNSTVGRVLVDINPQNDIFKSLNTCFNEKEELLADYETDEEDRPMNKNIESLPEDWMNDLDGSSMNQIVDQPIVTNKKFNENPEDFVEKTKSYSVFSLFNSIKDNLSGFQLQTNAIDSTNTVLTESSNTNGKDKDNDTFILESACNAEKSSDINDKDNDSNNVEPVVNKFKNQDFELIDGLPIVKFKDKYDLDKYKSKKTKSIEVDSNKRKRNPEHSFVIASTSREKYHSPLLKKNKIEAKKKIQKEK